MFACTVCVVICDEISWLSYTCMVCVLILLSVSCFVQFNRFLSRSDSVTVSVWNNRKVNRREGAGFLGCVRITPSTVTRLKDTGCK